MWWWNYLPTILAEIRAARVDIAAQKSTITKAEEQAIAKRLRGMAKRLRTISKPPLKGQ